MSFGPFRVRAEFGELNIATSAAAMAFVRSIESSHRASYHWKVAERMIHFASDDAGTFLQIGLFSHPDCSDSILALVLVRPRRQDLQTLRRDSR
jgi:hypothetical protein